MFILFLSKLQFLRPDICDPPALNCRVPMGHFQGNFQTPKLAGPCDSHIETVIYRAANLNSEIMLKCGFPKLVKNPPENEKKNAKGIGHRVNSTACDTLAEILARRAFR